ncbi:MAG: hypothetical protein AAFR56_13495 [Chloroflexota bacterium]
MLRFRFALLVGMVLATGCAPNPSPGIPTVAVIVEETAEVQAAAAVTAAAEPTEPPIFALPPTWTPTPPPTVDPSVPALPTQQQAPQTGSEPTLQPLPGQQIVFAHNAIGLNTHDVFVLDLRNDFTRNLTDNAVTDTSPVWGPDRERIAFVAERDLQTDLFVIRQDGDALRQLTEDKAIEQRPVWSPDGAYVGYISDADSPDGELYAASVLGGGSPLRMASGITAVDFAWSPDSRSLVFTSGEVAAGQALLHTVAFDERPATTLLFADDDLTSITGLAWSPDGTRIVASCNGMICVMNPDGTNLTVTSSRGDRPSWSPDGETIAFVCPAYGAETICIINRNLTNAFPLLGIGGRIRNTPQWSSDGRQLAFDMVPGDEPTAFLYILDIVSNEWQSVAQISTEGNNNFYGISWQPQ